MRIIPSVKFLVAYILQLMCTNTSKWAIETGRGGAEETLFCFAHQMCDFAERDNSETVCLFWVGKETLEYNILYFIHMVCRGDTVPPPKPLAPHPKISVAPPPPKKRKT